MSNIRCRAMHVSAKTVQDRAYVVHSTYRVEQAGIYSGTAVSESEIADNGSVR